MNVLGLDLSLTSSGICGPEDFTLTTFEPKDEGPSRLGKIRSAVMAHTAVRKDRPADLVVIEGYSYMSKFKQHELGEIGGVVRLALWENWIPYAVVPPKKRCKAATGNGNANKLDVFKACIRRLDLDPKNDDEADAAWLRAMGLAAYGQLDIELPKDHMVALQGITWPKLDSYELIEELR